MTEDVLDRVLDRVLDGAASRFSVAGKVAVVTGASYGLGQLFAQTLAAAGADLVLTARSADKLEETKKLVEARGARARTVTADVRVYEQLEAVTQAAVDEFGGIDVMVNNAGIGDPRGLHSEILEPEKPKEEIETDLVGTWYGMRAAAPHMLRQGSGSIINISSILGMGGHEHRTPGYVAAKAGVNMLTRSLGCEWADRGVRVNALAPNYFLSESTRWMFEQSGMDEWVRSRTPMRRAGSNEDLVGPLLFLASDASSYVTGAVIPVDGGWSASAGYAQQTPPFDSWDEANRPILPEA
ncbi:SDR family NAD(P)-dependent oxidoreductase [Nocardioides soli]|uniref:NAD(P)-dependent dehydrogenase (Short-subunit alcohol dehydrogenase family) n=1 Tax=Nocardioides soli TaxID=1036020 RepID=A0A7W4VWC3_9ACTN|nr:SDR family oxidoreductase [Nocardioides soli]MBB3042855.1 NAD(P)-dependent dehydrogenase (short-subunit alcohol dehydrogenase family) [Nocardioides soli]